MRGAQRVAVCLILMLAVSPVLPSRASDAVTGIIYGPEHAFAVTAPSGWVLDNKSGVEQGLWAVLYPTGSSWQDSNVVMYINTASKAGDPTLEGLIKGDLERQRKESPSLTIAPGEPLALQDGTKARVNHFSGDKWGNHESVAYIEAPTVWVMVVLSSRDEPAYKAALPAFGELVKSYKFLTTKVDIKK
jgi:hypothetical protein